MLDDFSSFAEAALINYTSSQCPTTWQINENTQDIIESPDYDVQTYGNHLFCKWLITAPTGKVCMNIFSHVDRHAHDRKLLLLMKAIYPF